MVLRLVLIAVIRSKQEDVSESVRERESQGRVRAGGRASGNRVIIEPQEGRYVVLGGKVKTKIFEQWGNQGIYANGRQQRDARGRRHLYGERPYRVRADRRDHQA